MIFQKKERVAIYIDGSNAFNKLKTFGIPEKGHRFDYSSFTTHLAGKRELVSKRYYIGIVKNHDNSAKGEQMVKGQQKFLEGLRAGGFDVKQGKIMYDGNDRIREKGVDVKLSVDLVIGVSDDLYDTAIVVSSDTDLISAVKYVRNGKRKKVEYVGFAGTPSMGMMKEYDTQRIFSKEDLVKFQVKKVEK
jgi:uncharacterized LabA/DUF88 family protein